MAEDTEEIWRAIYQVADRVRVLNVLKDSYRNEPGPQKKLNKQLGILMLRADQLLRQLP